MKSRDVNLVCVNGGPGTICNALALEADRRKLSTPYLWDGQPFEIQRKEPRKTIKVMRI